MAAAIAGIRVTVQSRHGQGALELELLSWTGSKLIRNLNYDFCRWWPANADVSGRWRAAVPVAV